MRITLINCLLFSLMSSGLISGLNKLVVAPEIPQNVLLKEFLESNNEAHPRKYESLYQAINKNNHKKVSHLLTKGGIDVNYKYDNGETPLIVASKRSLIIKSNYIIINELISKGADVNIQDNDGFTAFDYSIKRSDSSWFEIRFFKTLIDAHAREGDVIQREHLLEWRSKKQNNGVSDLIQLINEHRGDLIEALIKIGCDVNNKTLSGQTALMIAARNKEKYRAVEFNYKEKRWVKTGYISPGELDYKYKISDIDRQYFNNSNTLWYTYDHRKIVGYLESDTIINWLIRAGADLNCRDKYGCTALDYASKSFNVSCYKTLVNAGAKKGVVKNSRFMTPLMEAAERGGQDSVMVNLDKNIDDINVVDEIFSQTALMFAAFSNHPDIVKILLNKGADYHAKNSDGQTALIIASKKGYYDIVKMLLENGADVNQKDNLNNTSLYYARLYKNQSVIDLLLKAGAL